MGLLIGTGDFGLEELLIQAEAARDQAVAAAENASTEYADKGPYNATTNTPTLTADATIGQGSGKKQKYTITVPGAVPFAGKNFTAGTVLQVGDQLYQFSDGQWYLQPFSVGNLTITNQKIAPSAVSVDKLISWLQMLLQQLPDDSPYLMAITDAANRLAFAIRKDGYIEGRFIVNAISVMANAINTAALQANSVTLAKLATEVTDSFPSKFVADEYDYLYMVLDTSNRIGFAIKKDGTIVGKFTVGDGSITQAKIADLAINAAKIADGAIVVGKIAAGAVNLSKLATEVTDSFPVQFEASNSDYLYCILDSSNRLVFGIKKDGWITGKFIISDLSVTESKIVDASVSTAKLQALCVTTSKIADGAVSLVKLGQDVKDSFPSPFEATDFDYLYLVLDAMNRIGFGIKKDGTIVGKISIPDGSVTASKLASDVLAQLLPAAFSRLNTANANDVEIDLEDEWRQIDFGLPVRTPSNGFAYMRFAPIPTKGIRGLNSSGTSLQFRQSNRLNIKGRRYRGTFDPTANAGVLGTNYRGTYGNSYTDTYPAFTVGSVGDCWMANVTPGSTKTANGLTFKNGDLIVQTGTGTYAVQAGPGDGTFSELDFWNVTVTSQFGKINLIAGQRIIYLGVSSQSGPKYVEFTPSKIGEFHIMGECNPSTFDTVTSAIPTGNGILEGDLYICSASGTAKTLTVLESDSIAYEGGWFVVPGNVKTFANNTVVFLPCTNSNEWEVRRTDKSNTQVIVTLNGSKSILRRRVSDNVRFVSDSMFGGGSIGNKMIALLAAKGRSATVRTNGGGTSNDILSLMRLDIRTGDPYAGQTYVIWHGQNNPSGDIEQTQSVALQMASILGVKQKRFIFWSILGSRALSFNGTRMVAGTQEGAFAGTNFVANTEKWYELAFPKQWWSPRKACLELAVGRTDPDPNFPGMTEAQVAATYGIVPWSFFFDYSGKPFTASQLVYEGDWTTLDLPTSTVANHHYFRRTSVPSNSGLAIGNLIVSEGGVWTEYAADTIHISPLAADLLSVKFNDYLTLLNL